MKNEDDYDQAKIEELNGAKALLIDLENKDHKNNNKIWMKALTKEISPSFLQGAGKDTVGEE